MGEKKRERSAMHCTPNCKEIVRIALIVLLLQQFNSLLNCLLSDFLKRKRAPVFYF
ncbi:uncharacterized protein FA14DRAFT_160168 [Meira miltonrushii]|uniref:Uncharacterized protein n=1 Tax=Meira miltonrushii TaxID=1280837 RepID=A0A316VGN1_9BASI|nr:uncharacterized protein FA14DRAFT_160168 [Meira miltonrushii]PWN34655.1 hypothetical protein FA14DRAFT_160168 [Meira miltonrushii]